MELCRSPTHGTASISDSVPISPKTIGRIETEPAITTKSRRPVEANSSAGGNKPPALTEEQIVEAALEVIRTEGLDALSMRRLSRQLGRSAVAGYWYVCDKQELLVLVAGKLCRGSNSQIRIRDPGMSAYVKSLTVSMPNCTAIQGSRPFCSNGWPAPIGG